MEPNDQIYHVTISQTKPKVHYSSYDLIREIMFAVFLAFENIHSIRWFEVVDVPFLVVINKQIKGIVSICIVPCTIIDILVAGSVENSPLSVLFSEVYWKSLTQTEYFVACHLTADLYVIVAEDKVTSYCRKKHGFTSSLQNCKVKRILAEAEINSTGVDWKRKFFKWVLRKRLDPCQNLEPFALRICYFEIEFAKRQTLEEELRLLDDRTRRLQIKVILAEVLELQSYVSHGLWFADHSIFRFAKGWANKQDNQDQNS